VPRSKGSGQGHAAPNARGLGPLAPFRPVQSHLDRLFRSVADAAQTITSFDRYGIELVAISEGFDIAGSIHVIDRKAVDVVGPRRLAD
jgi:hypothetical protein